MVSRETTRPLRKLVPAVAMGVSALLGIVGCSAGQVAQTAEMEPAVNGNNGQVGNLLLRDVMVAFPENGEQYRAGEDAPLVLTIANVGSTDDELVGVTSPAGRVEIVGNASVPSGTALEVVLPADNPGASATTTETTSETSGSETTGSGTSGAETTGSETSGAETTGSETTGSEAPDATGDSSEPSATTTTEETAPEVVGTISLIITGLTGDLPFGKQVPVTFEFRNAGKVTVSLPVAAPATPREEGRDAEFGTEAEGGH